MMMMMMIMMIIIIIIIIITIILPHVSARQDHRLGDYLEYTVEIAGVSRRKVLP
jgi:uncharacterized membrane protein